MVNSNFSTSYRLGVIQCFILKGDLHSMPKICGFSALHALKFDFVSTRPQKARPYAKARVLNRHTPMRRSVRAVRKFEEVGN